MITRCNNCFKTYDSELDLCPYCGYEEGEPAAEPFFLFPGMVLNDRYIVGEVQGFGGFGIIYKAWDKNLDTIVAIKEYYYTSIATRQPGTQAVLVYAQNRRPQFQHFLDRFLDEARYTAKFSKNGNIVNVFEYFEANNTAYMVMEFLDGVPLSEFLKKNTMDTRQCVAVMQCICSALRAVHDEGIIHRDISPDNIILCSNGKVKLFDFGAARFSRREDQEIMKLTQVMKPGFSPPEQYQSISKQGPWTDIYALGATLYYMITGVKPVESTNRKTEDNLTPPKELIPDIPDYISNTIIRAMAVDMHLRFPSVDEFEKALCKKKKVLNITKEKRRRRKNRVLSLILVILLIMAGFAVFAYFFNQERLAETLPDSTIEFWYALPETNGLGEAKIRSYAAVIEIFNESFPNVSIITKAYPPGEYLQMINTAHMDGALPGLFESAGLDESILAESTSAGTAARTVNRAEVLFFGEYDNSFPGALQFPLGFNMPVRYTNITAPSGGVSDNRDKARFMMGQTQEYIGSTADYYDIQLALPARYAISPVGPGEAACEFTELLSIGNCDDNQLAVVNRFLVFLLSENAQDYLHIRYRSGALPLNIRALTDGFVSIYDEFSGFFDDAGKYAIE